MSSEPAFVVLMRVHLHFPDVGSLKGKRAELNRVKARLRERCGATVAPHRSRKRAFTRLSSARLPLSDAASGKCRWTRMSTTNAGSSDTS